MYLLIFHVVHCQGFIESTIDLQRQSQKYWFHVSWLCSWTFHQPSFHWLRCYLTVWMSRMAKAWRREHGFQFSLRSLLGVCRFAFKFISPPKLYSIHSNLTSCKVCCLSALDSLLNPNWLQESVDSQSSSSTTPKLSFHEWTTRNVAILQNKACNSTVYHQHSQAKIAKIFGQHNLATAKAPHACALAWTANVHWELSAELLQNVVILTEQCKLWKHTWMPNCKHLKM